MRFVKKIDYDDDGERCWSIKDTHKHHLVLWDLDVEEKRLDEIIDWLNEVYECNDEQNREKLVELLKYEKHHLAERELAKILVKSYIPPKRISVDSLYTVLTYEVTGFKSVNFPTLTKILGINQGEWGVGWIDNGNVQVANVYIDNKMLINRKLRSK